VKLSGAWLTRKIELAREVDSRDSDYAKRMMEIAAATEQDEPKKGT
jgi:hypothetical protein